MIDPEDSDSIGDPAGAQGGPGTTTLVVHQGGFPPPAVPLDLQAMAPQPQAVEEPLHVEFFSMAAFTSEGESH